MLLESHIRMLREVAEAGEKGIPASELIPKREYREFVLRYLVRKGYIRVRKQGAGGRVYITAKGLKLVKSQEKAKEQA